MARRLVTSVVLLLVVSIVSIGLGCAAPATPTAAPAPTVTPGVTPTAVAPAVKPMTIRFHQPYAMTYTVGLYVEKFKALIEERSGGKIKVDHYPSAQIFPQTEQYKGLATGAVQMIVHQVGYLATDTELAWQIAGTFPQRYFKDWPAFFAFWAEPAGGKYLESVVEKTGVKYLGYPLYGSKLAYVIPNRVRPVKKMEDFKGLKMGVTVGEDWLNAALGISAIPMAIAERETGVQTGMIDGPGAISPTGTLSSGFQNFTKYCTSVPAKSGLNISFFTLANLAWWNGLSDATKTMILKALEDSRSWLLDVEVPKTDTVNWKRIQDAYGAGFYDTEKQAPQEWEKMRVAIADAAFERVKKILPRDMFDLVESKYRY